MKNDIYTDLKCPKCGRKNCVQGSIRIDGKHTPSKITYLLRCTYNDCRHEWEDEEHNEIEEFRNKCIKIIDECSKEGLSSIKELHSIMDIHIIAEKAKESLRKLSEVGDE